MENLYNSNYSLLISKLKLYFATAFILFSLIGKSQSLFNTFTYGDPTLGQIPIFACESQLNLNLQFNNVQNPDSIVLFFPNSFHISGQLSNFIVSDSLSGFVEIRFPVNGSGEIDISFEYKKCLNEFAAVGSIPNLNNLEFQSYLLSAPSNSTFSYNSQNMLLNGGSPAIIEFHSDLLPFEIIPQSNFVFEGDANEQYVREFDVLVHATTVQDFEITISQEDDVEHQSLYLMDANGTSVDTLLNGSVGEMLISQTIDLNSITNYISTTNNIRALRFKQIGKLICVENNNNTLIKIERTCCSNNFIATSSLFGRIEEGQDFTNSSSQIIIADTSIENSCGGFYYYDLTFNNDGPIALLEDISIPYNHTFIDEIDSVYIGTSVNNFVPILNFSVQSDAPQSSNLIINFSSQYDSTITWSGFVNYADTSQTGMFGPWLDTNLFVIRVKLKYNCTQQQECGNSSFHLQGRKQFALEYADLFNIIEPIGESLFVANTPIILNWRNSCEVDTVTWIQSLNIQENINQAYVSGFAHVDHLMQFDRLLYTYYPNNSEPFNVLDSGGISDLSCNASTSFRAVFYIPYPVAAIDSLVYDVGSLFVGNESISTDSIFINDTLSIPLGNDLQDPIDFSFEYKINYCPFNNPPNSGGIELVMEIQAFCENCISCYKTVACTTMNAVVHCPGLCIGQVPMGTESVEMERVTFGFPDQNHFPNYPIDSRSELAERIDSIIAMEDPDLPQELREAILPEELSKLYPFDIVKLHAKGNKGAYPLLVDTNGNNFRFEKIAFELAHTPIGNKALFALKYANLKFLDTNEVELFSSPLEIQNIQAHNTEVFGMSGDTLYSFELVIPNISSLPQYDSINLYSYLLELDAEFWVLPDASNPINPILVRGQFICSTNVDTSISTYSCDPWGTQLKVLLPKKEISITTSNDTISYCVSNAKLAISLSGGLGDDVDDFPYEFRPFIGYSDTAFSDNFISGFAVENSLDTTTFQSTQGTLYTTNQNFLNAIEKPSYQEIYLQADKFCTSGSDSIAYSIPIFDYAYLSANHFIDSLFAPTYLTSLDSISLPSYSFYDSTSVSNLSQNDIQQVNIPDWQYNSINSFSGLFPGLPVGQVQGIAETDSIYFDLHVIAPDSLDRGSCWISYKFAPLGATATNTEINLSPYSDSLESLIQYPAVLDSLGEVYHFFPNGYPLDSVSTQLVMPVNCIGNNYKLSMRYGCFCLADSSFETFQNNVNSTPQCYNVGTGVNFQRQVPGVIIESQLQASNDTSGCNLTWLIEVNNPENKPNLTSGNLLINIPSGLVLETGISTFNYFLSGDTIASQNGNYLNDSIGPNYSFQFEDFDIPPTTVLVLTFPSVDTLQAGSSLLFALKFKLDESTCALDSAFFESNFINRILEARFTGFPVCNNSTIYSTLSKYQYLNNDSTPSIQEQIAQMADSEDCCLPSAANVSIEHPCSSADLGHLNFHFLTSGNRLELYQINDLTNADSLIYNQIVDTTQIDFDLPIGLFSATVTTNAGLIYVFNSLRIQNHGVQAHLSLTQESFCGGSPITLTAIDSNAVNNLGFNASNPFIATDTLTSPALNFQWLNSAVSVDSLDNSFATATPFSDTTYQVVISHLSGCIDTASINVNVSEMQTIQIELGQDSLCSSVLYPIWVSPSGGLLTINGVTNTDFILDPLTYSSGQLNIHYEIAGDSGCVSIDSMSVFSSQSFCNCISCVDSSQTQTQYVIPDSVNLSSQLIGILGSDQIANYCFELNHNFAIDSYTHFIGCEFTIAGSKEIKVTNGVRFENCILKGCQQMWAGINNYGKLIADSTLIKDAHYGILMQRNDVSYTSLSNTTFENNFVGIKTSDEIGEHPLTMKGCVFQGGNLLDVFPGQNPLPQDYSLAGIVAVNKYELNVAPSNKFTQLCNGVILNKQSSAYFLMVLFDNIDKHGTNYSGQNYWLDPYTSSAALYTVNGNAIFANSNSRVYFEGFGGLSNSNVCFLNCLKGINVNQSDLEVRNARFEGMTMGINAINERNKRVKILKNRITSRQFGVKLAQCDYMLPDTIGFNTINSIPVGTTSPLTINNGIRVENQYSAFGLQIIGNNITAPQGIFLNTVSGSIVKSDTLSLIPMFLGVGNGIYVSNTKKYELSCNQVQGNSTTIQTGIYLAKSPFGLIKNNNVDNTNRGFFVADNCQTDSFKLNTIHSHQIGLDITPTGILGNQINAGNRWSGNYSTTGARRQSTNPATSALSSFSIHDETNPILYPLNPPFQPFDGICFGDFFYCDPSQGSPNNPYCEVLTVPSGISQSDPNDEDQRYLAYLLATDSLNFDEFDEPVKFALRKDILTQLSSNQLTLPDTGVFIQFLNNLAQNPENDFVQIDKMLSFLKLSDSTQIARQSYINQMNLNLRAIHNIDSIMVIDSLFDDATLIAQKNEIKAIISSIYLQLDLIKNIAQENQYTTRDSSFQYNQGIVTLRDFEEYERRINDIYLNTVAIDSLVFSDQQVADIEEIARLCPSLGGEAVYRARSLYAIISDTAFYNDELTCLQQGVLFRLSGDKESKNNSNNNFKVIPNPNNGQFTLKANFEEPQILQMRVVSALGQIVYNERVKFDIEHNFNCLFNKSQGLYFIQVLDKAGEIIFSEKIIKN